AEEPRTIEPRDVSGDMLLIVDFQNVYLPGNDWACPSMPEAMANTIRILSSPGTPDYIMTRYVAPAEPVGRWKDYNEAYREINENAFLSELADEMAPYAAGGHLIDKSTYSSMDAPAVCDALEGKKAVVLAGVVADCCVLATMYDAMDMGYEVVYLYDCIAGSGPESEAEIRALAEIFSPIHTSVMSSEEYLAAIG
ncbi:MAG: cysteine hydrolase, partial [Oscillospiraceae bacterium]|nr:cysteine hydrolase [Oscillospiraceae bacterium]